MYIDTKIDRASAGRIPDVEGCGNGEPDCGIALGKSMLSNCTAESLSHISARVSQFVFGRPLTNVTFLLMIWWFTWQRTACVSLEQYHTKAFEILPGLYINCSPELLNLIWNYIIGCRYRGRSYRQRTLKMITTILVFSPRHFVSQLIKANDRRSARNGPLGLGKNGSTWDTLILICKRGCKPTLMSPGDHPRIVHPVQVTLTDSSSVFCDRLGRIISLPLFSYLSCCLAYDAGHVSYSRPCIKPFLAKLLSKLTHPPPS